MSNPVMEKAPLEDGGGNGAATGLLPVYRLTEGVSQIQLRAYVREALRELSAGGSGVPAAGHA